MKYITAFLLAGFLCLSAYSQVDTTKSHFWMMTYFINGADYAGTRLAFTSDTTGTHWQKYNSEAAILVPSGNVAGANDDRMRDPMIQYDSTNRRFDMVWTVSWTGTVIGYDTSSLLKLNTWGTQQGLAVGTSSGAYFSWAPEIFWDDIQSKFMLLWSCSISGTNTRVMYSMIPSTNNVPNFANFGTPATLLNTGYDIIDADMIKVGTGNYQMFFKDERNGYKYVRRASGATTPQGTYGTISGVVAAASTEGPTAFKQGNEYHVIVDHYSNNGFGIVRARNIDTSASPWPENWVINGTGTSTFIGSHCNVIEVPKALVKWMLYNDSTWVRFVKARTAVKEINYHQSFTPNSRTLSGDMKVFDVSGKLISAHRIGGTSSVENLPSGFYFQKTTDNTVVRDVKNK